MKAVLMSIRPQWCEKIFNGEKTVEVRKNAPKLETPFKVYVYCTAPKERWSVGHQIFFNDTLYTLPTGELKLGDALELRADWLGKYDENNFLNGKVIGSFVCDKINRYNTSWLSGEDNLKETTCLDDAEIMDYIEYTDREFYLWHITEPKSFDKPRELDEFYTKCDKTGDEMCGDCLYLRVMLNSFPCDDSVDTWCGVDNKKPITRPPQSWCYVEEPE